MKKRKFEPSGTAGDAVSCGNPQCEKTETDDGSFNYGIRLNMPYMLGVYLAVNAVPDSYIVVDGPDCSFFKGEFVFMKHDWCSTLFRTDGRHRILFTATNAQNAAHNREGVITRSILAAASQPDAGIVLLSYMPLGSITGTEYGRILRSIKTRVPAVEVPGKSLQGDWLDGYATALEAIVGAARLRKTKHDKESVAVVGHLMDRNEGDQRGNVLELKRIIRGLGLKPVLVWPAGESFGALRALEKAGTIISLPYGRKAAALAAKSTGARLIETDVPFGLDGTCRWIERIASVLKREKKAREFIDAELQRVRPLLTRLLPFYFLNCNVFLTCDPHMLRGFTDLFGNLGMKTRRINVVGDKSHMANRAEAAAIPENTFFEPFFSAVLKNTARMDLEGDGRPDLVVTPGRHEGDSSGSAPVLEIGFPSFHHHALTDTPFLGFEGVLHMAERIANARAAYKRLPG